MGDWQKEFDEAEERALCKRSRRKWLRRISLILGVIIVGLIGTYGTKFRLIQNRLGDEGIDEFIKFEVEVLRKTFPVRLSFC